MRLGFDAIKDWPAFASLDSSDKDKRSAGFNELIVVYEVLALIQMNKQLAQLTEGTKGDIPGYFNYCQGLLDGIWDRHNYRTPRNAYNIPQDDSTSLVSGPEIQKVIQAHVQECFKSLEKTIDSAEQPTNEVEQPINTVDNTSNGDVSQQSDKTKGNKQQQSQPIGAAVSGGAATAAIVCGLSGGQVAATLESTVGNPIVTNSIIIISSVVLVSLSVLVGSKIQQSIERK